MIPIFVGFDEDEAVAYHVFCHSVLARTKEKVSFTPVTGEKRDGSNRFIYARFLIPYFMDYQGWALWADGDMLCQADIGELWSLLDYRYDVMVVKHEYQTQFPVKYRNQKNEDYPRKNWSSLMLINCAAWRGVTPERVAASTGSYLHRFEFLEDKRIGGLPKAWNHLVSEYPYDSNAKIAHFTIGIPPYYPDCDYAQEWEKERSSLLHWSP